MPDTRKLVIIIQSGTIGLSGLAVCWGLIAIYFLIFPGPSGEWAGIAVLAAAVINLPVGLLALGVGMFLKRGSDRLRRICTANALVTLALPLLAHLVWRNHSFFYALRHGML